MALIITCLLKRRNLHVLCVDG